MFHIIITINNCIDSVVMNQLNISMKLERSLHIKGNMTMTQFKQDNCRTPQKYLCMSLSTKCSKARLVISNFFLKSRTTSKLTSTNPQPHHKPVYHPHSQCSCSIHGHLEHKITHNLLSECNKSTVNIHTCA
jgi:hypothetical protein